MTDPSPRDNSIHDAVDALFDNELSDAATRDLLAKADPNACEDIAKTQRIVNMLKAPVETPDLTSQILAQVEDEREFLASPWRSFVRAGRLAVAACLLLTLLSVAVAQRVWPEATQLSPEPRPMANLLHTTEREAETSVRALNDSLDTVNQQAGLMRDVVVQSRRAPEKFTGAERHVLGDVGVIRLTTSVETVGGAAAPSFQADQTGYQPNYEPSFETEVIVWRTPDPHGAAESATIAAFRPGWTISLDGMVQLQVLQRQAEPPRVAFRKLP